MTSSLVRFTPPSSRALLTRVLDDHELVAAVRGLPPRALARLVEHVGLEDAGELVALATADQLAGVLDEDLWRATRAGGDEAFDAARFVTWLEVLVEAGAGFAARRLVELPEDLVVHALHQHVLVIDVDALAVEVSELDEDEGAPIEKALEGCLYHELDEYRVIARRHDGWDAIVAVLTAMDEQHHHALARLLERLCALSSRDVDDGGGLYEVLTSEEMLAGDVAGEREDRRAREGFIAPSQARAFLKLAAQTELTATRTAPRDPVTRAYFRELEPPRAASATSTPADDRVATAGRRLATLLHDAGVLDDAGATPARAGALPSLPSRASGDPDDHDATEATLRAALAHLAAHAPAVHARRVAELAYLANVLVAGGDAGGRSFRPAEAASAVLTTCGLGLAHLRDVTGDDAAALVAREDADRLFRLGWRLLHERTGDPARALLTPRAARP